MILQNVIEEIVTSELRSLCVTCVHYEHCVYRQKARKPIIECELFALPEQEFSDTENGTNLKGLCVNCDHARFCSLPGKQWGVWHCEEYE